MVSTKQYSNQPLTNKQRQILDFIIKETRDKGYPPTIREICAAVKLKSTSSVYIHLNNLQKKGYVHRDPTKPRALEIYDRGKQGLSIIATSIPEVGDIAAGAPILAQENIVSYFPVPSAAVPAGDSFILRIRGDSMVNAGILDGDRIFVNSCGTYQSGDIVVALIGDSATVKTFYKEDGYVRLQPENDSMDPIIVKDCTILGKVFGVLRIMRSMTHD